MNADQKIAVIVGAGAGIGAAVARRFDREGYRIAVMARDADRLESVRKETDGRAYAVDVALPDSVREGFARVRDELGVPDVVVYNPAILTPGTVLDIAPPDFEATMAVNFQGAFHVVREVLPPMLERRTGTLLFTGGGIVRSYIPGLFALTASKHALRGLVHALAGDYADQGIHAAYVVVDGPVLADHTRAMLPDFPPEQMLRPDDIAETYWTLHNQPRSAWTTELDVKHHVS